MVSTLLKNVFGLFDQAQDERNNFELLRKSVHAELVEALLDGLATEGP
jgi:hypothetical protein